MVRGQRNSRDKNRALMLKFKFGTITRKELDDLHDAVKNIIYKAMHRNPVLMNFEDVYHEIWRKICRFRHTWNPAKDTMVSTWITIVAESVINSLRKKGTRRMCHEVLYEDIQPGVETDETGNPTGADYLSYAMLVERNDLFGGEYSSLMENVYSKLPDETDRKLLSAVEDWSVDLAKATVRKRKKIYRKISSETGISESELPKRMKRLQEAYKMALMEEGIDCGNDGCQVE